MSQQHAVPHPRLLFFMTSFSWIKESIVALGTQANHHLETHVRKLRSDAHVLVEIVFSQNVDLLLKIEVRKKGTKNRKDSTVRKLRLVECVY